jgi:hypothetical protein
LRFDLDAVLTETHPRWTKHQPDGQYPVVDAGRTT